MVENRPPILEKNGKGFIFRISYVSAAVTFAIALITLLGLIFMPYKAFADFVNESKNDRESIRTVSNTADSLARIGIKYSIENNFNMKLYFELGQPKNFKWTPYSEIRKKIYLDNVQ